MIDEHPFIVANALQSSANRYLLGFRVKLARREARKRGSGREREREWSWLDYSIDISGWI